MKRFPRSMALVWICSLVLAEFAMAADLASVSSGDIAIPAEGQGIFISAICGSGCIEPGTPLDVYILDDATYGRHAKLGGELSPTGKTPYLARDLKPGVYHVGVTAKLDTKTVPMVKVVTPQSQGPDYRAYFADDLPEMAVLTGRLVPGPTGGYVLAYTLQKWYSVTVTQDRIQPVVGLFLPKSDSVLPWSGFYPKTTHFRNETPKEAENVFWREIDRMSPTKQDQSDRLHMVQLLEKGGRVCVPRTRAVVSIGGDGWLKVELATIAGASTDTTSDRIESMASVRPVFLSPSGTPQQQIKETFAGLPPFQKELVGGDEVRVRNPNPFGVKVALRSGDGGKDFAVESGASQSVHVPDGYYEIYFVYSSEPAALYRGDSFTLKGNGVEIQIVQVVGGNYVIRKVKGNP